MRVAAAIAAAFASLFITAEARAFCGFYVSGADAKLYANASQVVLMREGTRTVLSMQNDYAGPPENFAMVVPVPVVLQKENVKTLSREIFARVDKLDAPRLVEFWEEDPCKEKKGGAHIKLGVGGVRPSLIAPPKSSTGELGVTIEAQFTVAEYDIVVLSAKDSSGLESWLRQEKYKIPAGSEPYLRPYVQSGSKFFVARVDAGKLKLDASGKATLSPLRFHYDSDALTLPLRLGLVNSSGTQDLIVHILGKGHRYEVANYPNVTIPTNLDVSDDAKSKFGAFYSALYDKTLEKNPKAIVTEYAWDAMTCDPCPAPPLTDSELITLGADVLPSVSSEPEMVDPKILEALGADAGKPPPAPARRTYYGLRTFVLTRLHARYDKDSLGEDLVFKEAPAIAGGREEHGKDGTTLEHGAKPMPNNGFQGRYAVRHPWSGSRTCANPMPGVWGGPPGGLDNGPPTPALGLAYAARNSVDLSKILRTDVSELGIVAEGPVPSGFAPSTTAAKPAPPASTPAAKSGCAGCTSVPSTETGTAAMLVGAAAVLAAAVRRRRRG